MLKSLNPFSKSDTALGKYVFIPVFYSVLSVFHFVGTRDFSIHDFYSRFIGIAAFENYNVAARLSTFYFSVGIFVAVFLVLAAVVKLLVRKNIIATNELSIFNLTSFCGLIFLFFRVTGAETYSSLNFLFAVHIALSSIVAYRNVSKNKTEDTHTDFFSWLLTISFCTLFLFVKITAHIKGEFEFSFTAFLAVFIFILNLVLRKYAGKSDSKFTTVFFADGISSLAWVPLLSVLSDELFMVLNQRNIFMLSSGKIFDILFAIIFFLKFYLSRLRNNVSTEISLEDILARKYFPVLAAGITAFVLYNPVMVSTSEMFESANWVLPVQQFFEFHKLPLADTFSSHMLSDFFTNFIYVFLNGYSNFCFTCYDFLIDVGVVLVVYYLLKEITGNCYWAFFITLFYPYAPLLVPSYVCFALIPFLAFLSALKNPSQKKYLVFLSTLFLLVLWRMDLGFAGIISATLSLLLVVPQKNSLGFLPEKFLRAFIILLITCSGIFVLAFMMRGGGIFQSIRSALDYFSSSQSYGYKELASTHDRIYFTLYFIFPFVIISLAGYSVYTFFRKPEIKIRLLCIATFYLSVYYFSNFQRGLVRHGLLELWDAPLTSFAFLVMMLGMLIYLSEKTIATKFLWVTPMMTLLISQYKFPQPELDVNNLYHQAYLKMKHFSVLKPVEKKIVRMTRPENFGRENYDELKSFIDKYLMPEETFADFSNTPMLYYYLHRRNPHFFSQSPISYHSEKLQYIYIEELKQQNIKMVLFSSDTASWFDNTDGVANTLRHYKIAEYLFEHYRPAFVFNKKCVWLRNDLPIPACDAERDTFSFVPKEFNIRLLPYVWGKHDRQFLKSKHETLCVVSQNKETVAKEIEKKYLFPPITDRQPGNYVLIRAAKKTAEKTELVMNYGSNEKKSGGFIFMLANTEMEDYVIRISTQYNWLRTENNWLTVYPLGGDVIIEKITLLKTN